LERESDNHVIASDVFQPRIIDIFDSGHLRLEIIPSRKI
jgi:hypothetical protein